MIKLRQKQIKQILQFKNLNNHFILVPPSRMFVFGEGKKSNERGICIETRLDFSVDEHESYSFVTLEKNGILEKAKTRFNAKNKIDHFDDLLNEGKDIAEFVIPNDTLQQMLRIANVEKHTHYRIFKKEDTPSRIRSFNAVKYYSEMIGDNLKINEYYEQDLPDFRGIPFYVYIKTSTMKLLNKDDYSVTVSDNGMITFEGCSNNLVYYLRDQRLGAYVENQITEINSLDSVLLFDPRRAKAYRHKIHSHI